MTQDPSSKNNKSSNKQPNRPKQINIVTIVVFALVAIFFFSMITRMPAGTEDGITQTDALVTSEFTQAVEQGRVETVVYDAGGETVTGTYYPAQTAGVTAADAFNTGIEAINSQLGTMVVDGARLDTIEPSILSAKTLGSKHNFTCTWVGQDSLGELMAAHPEIEYSITLPSPWGSILLSLLPILLIAGLLFFFFSQMNKANNSQMSFGKAKAKKSVEEHPDVKFSDVAGVDEAVEEMQEIKDFLDNPAKYQAMGAKIPRGCLLVGPPGTGKTLLARAVAGEAGVPFFSISGSDFVEMFVGVGASRVRDLFKQAKEAAPAIIFIDEIDAVGRQRGAGLGGGHDEREQTLNQLLVEMDGFEANDSVVLIAATNRSDVLDPALLRPGRFDRQIVVDVPDVKGREKILKVHAENKPLAADVNLPRLAKLTPGFTGADLANLLNEAAILSARRNKHIISEQEVTESMERVIAGPERKGRVLDENTRRTIAFHESGHALVGHLLPNADPVHKISIISRGRALGYTLSIPDEDKVLNSRNEMRDELAVFLGGRVAEEIFCDDITTGASNDLERATKMARSMVTNYGMSSDLGVQVFGQPNHEVFLGRDYGNTQDYSEETARRIDEEVARIMREAHDRAYEILSSRKDQMNLMATVLLERETVDGEACEALLDNKWSDYLKLEQSGTLEQAANTLAPKEGTTTAVTTPEATEAQAPASQPAPAADDQATSSDPVMPAQAMAPESDQNAPAQQGDAFLNSLEQKIKDIQSDNKDDSNGSPQ
ncbi:ATP-dependent zinc metalloprotease FtsH [Anaerotardibacter muris]|uniref:ATP-dependent zinc metalloprotease FtsH n=1 Tax=Anaerotardibacter muris TaxID=2941505 RepID=UPI00203C3D60|nr:ATP-dependent zinc metalloprotease FtsH [Anaerotardibacter muris]